MMNVLALGLVVTSLAAANVWSPSPEKQKGEQVIVKEGHRVVVVEYEKEGIGNTIVSISPQEGQGPKEKFKEAASVLPNLGQGLSTSTPPTNGHGQSAGELICDAFGKCKDKISSAISRGKEKASQAAQEVSVKAHKVEEEVKDAIGEAFGKAKEAASETAHAVEKGAKETIERAKHAAKTAADTSKTIGKDIARDISEKAETVSEQVAGKAKEAQKMAENAMDRVQTGAQKFKDKREKNLTEILWRGRDVAFDAVVYVLSPGTVETLAGTVQLLGFSTAYGMCVWITFVSSYVLVGVLAKQQLAMVQSKIYPVYFSSMAYCVGVALVGHLFRQWARLFASKAEMFQCYNLTICLLMLLTNLLYLEPKASKMMFERMKMEKGGGKGRDGFSTESSRVVKQQQAAQTGATATASKTAATTTPAPQVPEKLEQELAKSQIILLNERLKKLNTHSSFLNVLTLMALTWHLVYLGQRLHKTS